MILIKNSSKTWKVSTKKFAIPFLITKIFTNHEDEHASNAANCYKTMNKQKDENIDTSSWYC